MAAPVAAGTTLHDGGGTSQYLDASRCRCVGAGLEAATTRRVATFSIEAAASNGSPLGGAEGEPVPFVVHIRGRGRDSIARVGTYDLHVALRHGGTELPGSPFRLTVAAGPAPRGIFFCA